MPHFFKLMLGALAFIVTSSCAQPKQNKEMQNESSHKVLVAYFSATGTTEAVARRLAEATGGTLCPIEPARPYTSADLDWTDKQSRSSREHDDPSARPELKATEVDVDSYDLIFLGYPIWWDEAPRAVNTFIEAHALAGKTVVPFATSGGSGVGPSASQLKKTYPDVDWRAGKLLNGTDDSTLRKWAEGFTKQAK